VHVILLEYGDKTSPAIWDTMKTPRSDRAAAPTPQEMPGTSLYSMQRWGDENGSEAFLLGGNHRAPVVVPITGDMWSDGYEVCRDKKLKFSADGRRWRNYSAWNPTWSAVCWYDVVLIRRSSKALLAGLLADASVTKFHTCARLARNWYPSWIHNPMVPNENLKCAHPILHPEQGHVCSEFFDTRVTIEKKRELNSRPRASAKFFGGRGRGRASR